MANNTIPANPTGGASAAVPTTAFPVTSNFTITIIGPPPPFPAPPRSVDLSPLKFILAVIAVIAIPALAYALFFAVPCPPGRSSSRRRSSSEDLPSSAAESAPPSSASAADGGGASPVSGVKFQKETHSKEIGNDCPVCLSVFADGEDVRQLGACKHAFHSSCIDMWLSNNSNCPVCRAAVPGKRPDGNGNGNGNRSNVAGSNRRISATSRNNDWHQGLPDASSLV